MGFQMEERIHKFLHGSLQVQEMQSTSSASGHRPSVDAWTGAPRHIRSQWSLLGFKLGNNSNMPFPNQSFAGFPSFDFSEYFVHQLATYCHPNCGTKVTIMKTANWNSKLIRILQKTKERYTEEGKLDFDNYVWHKRNSSRKLFVLIEVRKT